MAPALKATALTKEFSVAENTITALRDVDLAIEPGEFVAIMGPSGSGKTTLLQLLGGLDYPTSGDVFVNGTLVSNLTDEALSALRRQCIGFVFQSYQLIPVLTARENVALPLMLAGLDASKHAEQIDELLTMVGLDDRQDHFPSQLSGGQQQRVAIARALVSKPVAILADEPTGALDFRTGQEVMRLLRRLCKELGYTIVLVTHDVNAATHADRVAFLRDGSIVAEITVSSERRTAAESILKVLDSLMESAGDAAHA